MLAKKVLMCILVAIMVLSMIVPAMATEVTEADSDNPVPVELTAEPATFSVTVPSQLPITVDADGEVITATDAKIVNNSHGAVVVSNLAIEGQEGWEITDYENAQMHAEKVGSKKVALVINGAKTTGVDTIDFESGDFPKMDGQNDNDSDELPITYDAKVPAQKTTITEQQIANVVFTIGWDE